ncbi:MAG: Flp family type IVb pilin [Pseudomonadota bacterium]
MARFARDSRGATAIEYALMGSLVALLMLGVAAAIGESLFDMFTEISDAPLVTTTRSAS